MAKSATRGVNVPNLNKRAFSRLSRADQLMKQAFSPVRKKKTGSKARADTALRNDAILNPPNDHARRLENDRLNKRFKIRMKGKSLKEKPMRKKLLRPKFKGK